MPTEFAQDPLKLCYTLKNRSSGMEWKSFQAPVKISWACRTYDTTKNVFLFVRV